MTVSATAAVTAADAPQPVPTAPDPAPPTSHDPHEWVARFVGDKGPLQISSMSRPWNPEEFEPEEKITRTEVPPLAPRHPRSTPAPPRPRSGGGLRVITTVALILVAALAVILLVLRATRNAPSPAARAPDVTTTAADRPQSRPAAPSRASRPAARAAVDPGTAQPAVSPGTPDAAPPIPRGPYTLDAGVQLDQQTAFQECDRMQKLTGIRAWIVPAADPGSGQYRIVLGVFRSYTRASSAARMLMTSRTLANVTVVTLPPRDSRH